MPSTLLEELMRQAHEIANNSDLVIGEKRMRKLMENAEEKLRQHQKRKNNEEKLVAPKKTSKIHKTTQKPLVIATHNSYEPLNNDQGNNDNQINHEPAVNNIPDTTDEEVTTKLFKPTKNERKKHAITADIPKEQGQMDGRLKKNEGQKHSNYKMQIGEHSSRSTQLLKKITGN